MLGGKRVRPLSACENRNMAWSVAIAAWSAVKSVRPVVVGLWSRGRKVVYRLDDLESRIAALENQLKSQPADVCLYCGERAARLYYAGPPLLDRSPIARIEDWKCAVCGQEERRARIYDPR